MAAECLESYKNMSRCHLTVHLRMFPTNFRHQVGFEHQSDHI